MIVYLFWTYVLNRTKFRRHIYGVGLNIKAARFAVTGLVLLAAVAVDSFGRRRQERAGRA